MLSSRCLRRICANVYMASVRNRSSPAADVVKPFYFQDILEQEKPLDTPWKKLTSKYIIHLVISMAG